MMTDRQKQILKAIIEEYIKDANPVGSKKLAEGFDFGIGPAMLRQEMAALEKGGYLMHPHTSAGRIPTDKAYRLYINQELNKRKNFLSSREQERINKIADIKLTEENLVEEISRVASEISRELSITGIVGGNHYTHGYSYLANGPEFEDFDLISEFMMFMDGLNRSFGQLFNLLTDESVSVFIGRENPIENIQNFTIITDRYHLPRGGEGFVSIVGPKRMDYKKNMALVEYISQTIEDLAK